MIKKIAVLFFVIIMGLTPIFLTGCDIPSNTGGNTGGNNGGNNGGGTIPEVPEILELSDYFSGAKITYHPDLSGDLLESEDNNNNGIGDKQDYINDMKSQVNTMSKEVIIRLMAEYGKGVDDWGYQLIYEVGGEGQSEMLYLGGFDPFDANPPTFGNTYAYAHKDAVRRSYYSAGSYNSWNWSITEDYNPSQYIDTFISTHSLNLQLAIFMIKLGKNIHQVGGNDYNEYLTNIAKSLSEKESLLTEMATKVDYIGMIHSEYQKLQSFILNVIIGQTILNIDNSLFQDMNANALFDAEQYVDANSNGVYDVGEVFNDLNKNLVFDKGTTSEQYDYMENYFKNYVNTVKAIVLQIEDNTTRYPKIAGLQYQDFTVAQIESTGDETFILPTGYQAYQSLVLMNDETVNLESIWLAIESTRNFNLQIRARYHKVGQGIIFEDLLYDENIVSGPYDFESNGNDFLIDVENILAEHNVEDTSLTPFINNTESYDDAIVLNSRAPQADYFILEQSSDGEVTLAKYNDSSTDYFEIIFYASPLIGDTNLNPIQFKLGIVNISFSEIE